MSKEVAKIMEILESKSYEVDNHNKAVFESDFEDVAIAISDICFLPVVSGSLPFSEFEGFRKWIELESWYESSDGEYDKFEDPSCITLNINELYEEYKRSNDR